MPYDANGQWYSNDGEETWQGGSYVSPVADPNIGPDYRKFSDLYREDLARLRQKNDARMRDYGPVDAFGGSQDYLPPTEIAPDVQMQHDRAVQKYNADLARQAFGTLQKGMENFQYYRPGGAASLAQGLYQGQAQTLLAGRMDPLDLMYNARADASFRTRQKSRNAGMITGATTLIGAGIGTVIAPGIGTAIGAGLGMGLGGAINGAIGGADAGGGAGASGAGGVVSGAAGLLGGSGGEAAGGAAGGAAGAATGMGGAAAGTIGGAAAVGGAGVMSTGNGAASANSGAATTGGPNVNQQGSSGGSRGAPSQGTKTVGGPGAQGMRSAAGPFSPSGMGRMGLNTGAVADTYEMRTGQPIDVTYAAWAADEVVGTMDVMHARLDRLIATT